MLIFDAGGFANPPERVAYKSNDKSNFFMACVFYFVIIWLFICSLEYSLWILFYFGSPKMPIRMTLPNIVIKEYNIQ